MSKRNFVKVIVAGIFAGAGVAQADGTAFPLAAEVGPFQRHAESIASNTKASAAQPVFPRAEIDTYVEMQQRMGTTASPAAQLQSVFPAMAETGPRI